MWKLLLFCRFLVRFARNVYRDPLLVCVSVCAVRMYKCIRVACACVRVARVSVNVYKVRYTCAEEEYRERDSLLRGKTMSSDCCCCCCCYVSCVYRMWLSLLLSTKHEHSTLHINSKHNASQPLVDPYGRFREESRK